MNITLDKYESITLLEYIENNSFSKEVQVLMDSIVCQIESQADYIFSNNYTNILQEAKKKLLERQ